MDRIGPNAANSSPLTPVRFLERTATVYGDCPSVVYNDTVFTWSDTLRRCLRLVSSISNVFRVSHGDVVSVLAPNVPAMYELHFAVPMSGAVLNTINTRLDARTIAVILSHGGARVVFSDVLALPLLHSALQLLPSGHPPPRVVPIDDPYEPSPDLKSLDLHLELSYEKLIEIGDPDFRWIRPNSEWSPAVLNYTSGTTSAPKGVVHCHRGLFVVTVDSLIDWSMPKRAVFLWTLPMFHANGWSFPWGIAAVGGTNICIRRVDASTVFSALEKHGVTHMCGAPVVLNMLVNAPPSERRKIQGRKVNVITAGAPPPPAVLRRAEAMGFDVTHGYGLTETAGVAISCAWKGEWDRLPAEERARMKARQGVHTPLIVAADVMSGDGRSVSRDGVATGEIVLRGANVMLGYLKDEEATKKAVSGDGWFFTGDVGVVHPDGYIEIRDRSKDVIISGGENISSVEVESVLYTHPAVNEAAVVARPDDFWGETPCAFVSLRDDGAEVTAEQIIKYCREKMPHYMVPKSVVVMDDLPKTSTGKIKKFVLRDEAKKLCTLHHPNSKI